MINLFFLQIHLDMRNFFPVRHNLWSITCCILYYELTVSIRQVIGRDLSCKYRVNFSNVKTEFYVFYLGKNDFAFLTVV
jgi:hypothetical protein